MSNLGVKGSEDRNNQEAPAVVQCGACLGTGTVASYSQDGGFDPVGCDSCGGFGVLKVDANGRRRNLFGRFA